MRNWSCRPRTETAPQGSLKPPRHFREEDVCAAGALSYSSAAKKKSLGDVRKDRFKAFGGGAAAKKGQGKEKLRCLRRKKKSVEKVTGRSSPFEGWFCAVPWGGAGRPHRPRGRKTLGLSPCDPASRRCGPSPALGRLPLGPPSDCARESR